MRLMRDNTDETKRNEWKQCDSGKMRKKQSKVNRTKKKSERKGKEEKERIIKEQGQ